MSRAGVRHRPVIRRRVDEVGHKALPNLDQFPPLD